MTVEEAVTVFARGFAFGRSFTHPFVATHVVPGLWVLSDAPRRVGEYRGDEVIAYDTDRHGLGAEDVHALARRHARARFTLGVVRDQATADGGADGGADSSGADSGARAAFKGLGYRLIATEPLMVRDLGGGDDDRVDGRDGDPIDDDNHDRRDERRGLAPGNASSPAAPRPVAGDPRITVARVTTVAAAVRLAKAARRRQILPEHLTADPPPMRSYTALDGALPIGWVSSVVVGEHTWCSNLFVTAPYRRRGIGGALMRRMLADDAVAGSRANVLLASRTGALLYPTVGYRAIGELLIFTPPRR